MGKPKNTNHHYLPKCYLRQFSADGKSIWTYNKARSQAFLQSIRNAAQFKDFYRVPEELLTNPSYDVNFLEKEFFANDIEPRYASLLEQIARKVEDWMQAETTAAVLSQLQMDHFAALLAIQFLRLPEIRNKYWNALNDSANARLDIIKAWMTWQFPEHQEFIKSIRAKYDPKGQSIIHATYFGLQQNIDELQDALLDKWWVFKVANKGDLYTSDAPILRKPHLAGEHLAIEGFAMRGVEIIFPINPHVVLSLWDKRHFPDKKEWHNRFMSLTPKQLRQHNIYTYWHSTAETFCLGNNFDLIGQCKSLNDNKEMFAKRSRILVNRSK